MTQTNAVTDTKAAIKVDTVITEAKKQVEPYGRKQKSKIIYVYHRNRGGLPFRDPDGGTLNKIGSSYSIQGQDVLRGLSNDEEVKYLPSLIGTSISSPNWDKDARNYWANISKIVPPSKEEKGEMTGGLRLEVGRAYISQEDEEFDATCTDESLKKGFPININDFILWRYCLVYNRVANTKELVESSPKIDFYLYSKEEDIIVKKSAFKVKKDASQLFYSKMADRSWVDWLLRVFVANDPEPKIFIKDLDKVSEDEKDIALEAYVNNQPEKFHKLGTDASLELRSFIELAISKGRLSRIPNTDTIQMGDLTLGNTILEVIAFLKNEKNFKVLDALKAQVKVTP